MEIKELFGKHSGKTIALVGSGPTAFWYEEQEDISIAINGAIQLNRNFDYHIMFDTTLWKKDWFFNGKATRIIGYELAGMYSVDREKEYIFHYINRTTPVFSRELESLSSVDNIAVCAVEMAINMGATVINIYGIDMNERIYFYDDENKPKGRYGNRTVEFLNKLFELCEQNGITVNIYGSDSCRLVSKPVEKVEKVVEKPVEKVPNKKFLISYEDNYYQVTCKGYTATLMVPWGAPWASKDKRIVIKEAEKVLGKGYVVEVSEELEPLFKGEYNDPKRNN